MMEMDLEAGDAFVPGRYWVEFFPFLRFVPAWVPGAGFQKDFAVSEFYGLARFLVKLNFG